MTTTPKAQEGGGAQRPISEVRCKWSLLLVVRPTSLYCILTSHLVALLPQWRPWATYDQLQKSVSKPTPPSWALGVVAMDMASEDHDLVLKYQSCGHIPPQAPHWAPTWHYYNTG